jgi:predicted P-loop ATPase
MGNVAPTGPQRKPAKLEPADWKFNVKAFSSLNAKIWVGTQKKVPRVLPNGERGASSTSPSTWGDYTQAARWYEKHQADPTAGVGLMLSKAIGLIALDFDGCLDEDGLVKPWAQALVSPFIGRTYVERSMSGKGLHVFLRNTLPGVRHMARRVVSKENHEAVEVFSEPHLVTLSGDVYLDSRELKQFDVMLLEEVLIHAGLWDKLHEPLMPVEEARAVNLDELPLAVEALNAIDPDCDRETWLHCGMAMRGAFGVDGHEPWFAWSAKGAKFNRADAVKVWRSFDGVGIGLGTLFHNAKLAGWKPPAKPSTSAAEDFKDFAVPFDEAGPAPGDAEGYEHGGAHDWQSCGLHLVLKGVGKNATMSPSEGASNIDQYLRNHPRWKGKLRFNERTGEVESSEEGTLTVDELTKHVLWFMGWRRSPSVDSVERAMLAVARGYSYDPVKDWLKQQQWDGVERLSRLVANLGLEDSEVTRSMMRRWMIGAVARAFVPGCEMQNMLVLVGAQGKKKSKLFKALAVRSDWYSESHLDMNSKEGQIQLLGPWIYEVAELSGMSRAEVEKVKSFVSEATSRYRAPYERKSLNHKRRVVLGGTTNQPECLKDETGSRRFWLVMVEGELHLEYLTEEVVSQLWAEAVVAYRSGERWWDEGEEVEETSRRNEAHYQKAGLDVLVEAALLGVRGAGTTSESVLLTLVRDRAVPHNTKLADVAGAMKRLGWHPLRLRLAGKHGPQRTVYRRPGLVIAPEKEHEALLLALKQGGVAPEFSEAGLGEEHSPTGFKSPEA